MLVIKLTLFEFFNVNSKTTKVKHSYDANKELLQKPSPQDNREIKPIQKGSFYLSRQWEDSYIFTRNSPNPAYYTRTGKTRPYAY